MSFFGFIRDIFDDGVPPYAVDPETGRRRIGKYERQEIWRRFNKECYHCGKTLRASTAKHMHIDHLIPISKGGSNDDDNLVASCPKCNLRKGDRDSVPNTPMPRKKKKHRVTKDALKRCPSCGFAYGWDGVNCKHCKKKKRRATEDTRKQCPRCGFAYGWDGTICKHCG